VVLAESTHASDCAAPSARWALTVCRIETHAVI